MKRKLFYWCLSFNLSFGIINCQSQYKCNLIFGSVIEDEKGKILNDVTVEFFKNGVLENKTTNGSDGRFRLEIPILDSTKYSIVLSKNKCITKSFEINTSNVPSEKCGFELEIRSISINKKLLGVDYEFLKNPLLIIHYNPISKVFDIDQGAADATIQKLTELNKSVDKMKGLQDSLKDVEIENNILTLKLKQAEIEKLNYETTQKQNEILKKEKDLINSKLEIEKKEKALLLLSEQKKKSDLELLTRQNEFIKSELEREKTKREIEILNQDKKNKDIELEKQKIEIEKKELEAKKTSQQIELLNKDKLFQNAELDRQKTLRYALFGGLGLVLLFSAFMVNRFRVIRKQKRLIELKELETQRQKELVEGQKKHIEEKQKEILDSIYYARRIQRALITSEKYIDRNLNSLSKDKKFNGS